MKRLSIVFAFLLISIVVFSQKEANNWIFPIKTGLSFNTEPPTVLNTTIPAGFGSSCYSDSDGNLLLTTNGHTIWNGSGNTIMNGVGIGGDQGCVQSSLIVPDPSRSNSLYVFTVDKYSDIPGLENRCFSYSRVNLTGDNGNGSVSEKEVLLLAETPEYVTGVQHANGSDFWVVTHQYGNSTFYVYPITKEKGLHADNPKIFDVGSEHLGTISPQGMLKFSPDGKYLASTQIDGILELFSFNNEIGEIKLINTAIVPDAFGVEFDADSRFLYVSTHPSSTIDSQILQYDLLRTDPLEINYVVNTIVEDTLFASLQLGPDRKIYCAKFGQTFFCKHVAIIHNPSRPGAACNFNRLDNASDPGIDLGGEKLIAGLPNFVSSFLDKSFFTYDSICYNNVVSFDIRNKDNIDAVTWDFGDPTTGAQNISTDLSAMHVFSAPGTYTVTVESTFNGDSYFYSQPVVVNPLPEIDFGSDTIYLFPGAIAPLEIAEGYTSYDWSTGSTSNLLLADQPGSYHVVVTDSLGCINRKTVMILSANIYFPNAFTPNSDGVNDEFTPKGANSGLYNIRMFVYNRMGQLMYESPVLAELGDSEGDFGWDGTKNGVLQPTGSYVWIVKFDVEKEKGQFNTEHYSGNVMLLR